MKKQNANNLDGRSLDAKTQGTARKSVTVLHVDDDPNDSTLLQVACAKADVGFELLNVHEPHEVIEYLSGKGKYADRSQYQMPELVLLDMKMPRATGLDILKWIRRESPVRHLPVIVLSGSELTDDMQRAFADGANSYLVKPPNFDSLVKLVQHINAQLPSVAKHPGGASRSCS